MTIDIRWENTQHTIIRWTFTGTWTWDDFEAAQREFHAMLHSVEHMVDVIADLRHSQLLPQDTFANFKRLERSVMSNRDRVILVTTNLFIKSMAKTYNQVFKYRKTEFLLADTIEDAQQILVLPKTQPANWRARIN